MKLKATTNIRQYIKTTMKEEKRKVLRATIIANQRAAKQGLTEGKQEIKNNYTIKATEINKNTKVLNGTNSNPAAKIKGFGKGISMRVFTFRPNRVPKQKGIPIQNRKPVMVEIKKGEWKEVKSAFLLKLGKNIAIFKRIDGQGKKFRKLLGPGIAQMLGLETTFKRIKLKVKEQYGKIYEAAYKYSKSK